MSDKKLYIVSIPIAGHASFEVEATNHKEAIEGAWDQVNVGNWDDSTVTWEFHEKICEGNVCHAECNEIDVHEIKSR